jgi:hypothetical protein
MRANEKRDKPRQGIEANRLNLFRNGSVSFIDWLGRTAAPIIVVADPGGFDKSPGKRVLE